jgi:hypothetical protein
MRIAALEAISPPEVPVKPDEKPRDTGKLPRQVPRSAGRVARPSDEIEEEEMKEAQADGRVHAQSRTPTIAPGDRRD